MEFLGIDVGGSGIKGALVDTDAGELASERFRIDTPKPATPAAVAKTVGRIVRHFDYDGLVGCCFPSVIVGGVARTAGNIDPGWRGTSVVDTLGRETGCRFVVLNDADAAGVAEMNLGAGRGLDGLVIMITIGTGLGSGVFHDGELVPNIELGFMPGKDGKPIERYASNHARKKYELDWEEWGDRFNYFLKRTARVMAPDHFILGGGASKRYEEYRDRIDVDVPIRIAEFRNNAGIIGAARRASKS